MALPAEFPQANLVWKGWEGDETKPPVMDLHVFHANNESMSCWKLSLYERLCVLFTGRVWVHVWGQHPPVAISGEPPDLKEIPTAAPESA